MKLISWNVNGLRAIQKKGFEEYVSSCDADIFCLQETKLQEDQISLSLPDYHLYWSFAEKKGYSGTALFSKTEPIDVSTGIGHPLDNEGRTVTAEFEDFYVVSCYTPNSQSELARLDVRMDWDEAFRAYVSSLKDMKGVIVCGDLNVAHNPIDLKNPKSNERNAGYTIEERQQFTKLLEAGFIDTFRLLYPEKTDTYSWWSYRFRAREKNAGWRIDYWLVSEDLKDRVEDSSIDTEVMGSDHAPVILNLQD
ncbi:MAG: exodeoxyribonuclease III [Sphaerochaeta sp.]|uniref:exodeoxyribonuclease III n=1 Tax=Sphaerochaeta sp. S2 TaxID=2798868 RepID=UPI0018E98F5A|nr:exodeoxyribonuclease III [Sphaerochaeta sp. S2]MBJ2356296.1 exodeoxyribonuclease III [Sphaerochaeta sp. S2]MCK9349299.1 exodeoxyribonuclease III [Sphaerochaeta sp.]MDD4302335.1 exodeoxyribonuclease III [Sphaerochaeta sp.]MDD4647372.1 exodeoxyribonuclease III [Sphaerochaeta sp.]